jgi:hypothetical protein
VHAFKLPHALLIGMPFSGFSGTSNTHSNLGFGTPLLHRLILLVFLMLILQVVELTKKALLIHFLESSLVCWSSHKQTSIAQSTTEVEYVATAIYCSQILWIMHITRDYRVSYKSVPPMCDSSSAICLAQNPVFHGRAKHIKVRHHFLRDHVEKGDIEMKYIETERQLANIFAKPLDVTCFASLWGELGVCHPYGMV